ncbi:hypothetical protein NARC_130038 [Candidatus Nitrosocosmicus arcticus]|uniref:Uncharacterized protein n=1 Tax=Candidatus Nitrosocosmicus arcticus TaxID=2035267 RepID=A0A557SSW0_9ARCH|nr:hypothetical protein NARC_130038 [Candidatus Nitrosocosmicus arcticus]
MWYTAITITLVCTKSINHKFVIRQSENKVVSLVVQDFNNEEFCHIRLSL